MGICVGMGFSGTTVGSTWIPVDVLIITDAFGNYILG